MGLTTYALIIVVAVLISLCDAFLTTQSIDKLEHSSIKYSSYGATERVQNRDSLRSLESADSSNDVKSAEEERGIFNIGFLKNLEKNIPGTAANAAKKAAKKAAEAKKEAARIAKLKAQFERLATNDNELFDVFSKWKKAGIYSKKVLRDLDDLGLDTPKYFAIAHRYQIYLDDLAQAAKLPKKAKETAKAHPSS